MECNCKYKHDGFCKMAFRTFGLLTYYMEMGYDMIKQHQEQDSEPKTYKCRKKRPPVHIR